MSEVIISKLSDLTDTLITPSAACPLEDINSLSWLLKDMESLLVKFSISTRKSAFIRSAVIKLASLDIQSLFA